MKREVKITHLSLLTVCCPNLGLPQGEEAGLLMGGPGGRGGHRNLRSFGAPSIRDFSRPGPQPQDSATAPRRRSAWTRHSQMWAGDSFHRRVPTSHGADPNTIAVARRAHGCSPSPLPLQQGASGPAATFHFRFDCHLPHAVMQVVSSHPSNPQRSLLGHKY
jgi:hypothetical protein